MNINFIKFIVNFLNLSAQLIFQRSNLINKYLCDYIIK
jgi:hypothetical protein